MKLRIVAFIILALLAATAFAKDKPPQVMDWPSAEKPLLRITVKKITSVQKMLDGQKIFSIDTSVENLSGKRIPRAVFNLYLLDKQKVRVGDGTFSIENVQAAETVRVQVTAQTMGTPEILSISAKDVPAELGGASDKKISITVYSVPSGAALKIDGQSTGVTPIAISLSPGSHTLEFVKEGFSPGTFPLAISPDQLSGGSISYELGSSAHDSIELRDGTILTADVEAVSATTVSIRIGGNVQEFDRNQIKRILFIVRQNN